MACDLQTTLQAACDSGIAKLSSPVELLQVIAQTLCSAEIGSDPYDGNLTYIQSGGATTVIVGPVGAYNLSALAPKVTEIHAHNCPLLTSLTCASDALLTVLDLEGCAALETLVFNNCAALPSVTLDSSFVDMDSINFESCSSLSTFTANSVTTISGDLNLRSQTIGSVLALTSFSMNSLSSVGGSLYIYTGTGGAPDPGLSSITFPSLASVTGDMIVASMSLLESLTFPLLVSVGSMSNFSNTPLLDFIDVPLLESSSSIYLVNCVSLPTFEAPSLISVNEINATASVALTSFDATSFTGPTLPATVVFQSCLSLAQISIGSGSMLAVDGGYYDFLDCDLTQLEVDDLIQSLTDAGTTSTVLDTSGGTNSSPDATHAAQVVTLNLAGNSVTTN